MTFSYPFQKMIEKNANHEQLVAITTAGGHILSAGAGSGKTYVLVHHTLLKTEKIIFKNWKQGHEQILKKVKKFFCETVLMTFTKKSAFEIQIRMRSAIERFISESSDEDEDGKKLIGVWTGVLQLIDSLNIVTIDGFCFKIVANGLLPSVTSTPEIIESWQSLLKIENILKKWTIEYFEQQGIEEAVVDSKVDIDLAAKIIAAVYANPLRHFEWSKKLSLNLIIGQNDYQEIFSIYLEFIGYDELRRKYDLSKNDISVFLENASSKQKEIKWFENYKMFGNLIYRENYDFLSFIKSWKDAYSSIMRLTIPKNVGTSITLFFEELSSFRKSFLEMHDVFIRFETDLDTINKWLSFHRDIFSYCEKHYYLDSKITFSDLEYLVCKSLQDQEVAKNLAKYYNFFIIDEFQDTSEIQFLIVQKIIENCALKLFVVGDVKQAIYGFRGGELEVFKRTSNFLPIKLSLIQNYRSSPAIINFNNLLFEYVLFQKHLFNGAIGLDPSYFSRQIPPPIKNLKESAKGHAIQRNVAILNLSDANLKLSVSEIEDLEAKQIAIRIKKLVSTEDVTVLYSKLRPSLKLIKILIKEEISFRAQAKIPLGEHPIYGLLKLFLKYLIYKENGEFLNSRGTIILEEIEVNIIIYCCLISKKQYSKSEKEELEIFFNYYKLIGPFESFRIFLLTLGISSCDLPAELEKIERYFKDLKDNINTVYGFLNKRSAEENNIHFCWGAGVPKVTIMTVHASKGLEFENVFLGGVSSNGIRSQTRDDLGEHPASFKYRFEREKLKRKTPWYLYEKKLNEEKEKAESLRLFYVACTRAISRLEWFEIWPDGTNAIAGTNSWLTSLISFFEIENNSDLVYTERINVDGIPDLKSVSPPLIYFTSQGLSCDRPPKKTLTGIMAEMSVTKFSTIAECPHKYYLRDILKINTEELLDERDHFRQREIEKEDAKGAEVKIKIASSAERGSLIHQEISKFIIDKNSSSLYSLLPKHNVDWLKNYFNETKIKYQDDIEVVIEKQFKFSLFHQMISAIPDMLIKRSKDQCLLEIWDFKTGEFKKETLSKYWTQLMAYAYGQHQLRPSSEKYAVKLKIIYVDKMRIEEKSLSQDEISTSLYQVWLKLSDLNQYNRESCGTCSFKNVCVHCTETRVC